MPHDKQLIEQLLGMKREAEEAYGLLGNTRANTYQEAIDTIERLEAERDRDVAVLEEMLKLQTLVRLGLAEAQRNHSISESGEPVKAYWDGKQKALGEVLGKLSTMPALQHAQEQVGEGQ